MGSGLSALVTRWFWIWGPPLALMAALFTASNDVGPTLPGRTDLVAHVSAYFVLGVLFIRAFAGGRWQGVTRRALILAWLATTAYGLSDEIHQAFVAGRDASVEDWVADAIGASLAVALSVAAARTVARRRPVRGRDV